MLVSDRSYSELVTMKEKSYEYVTNIVLQFAFSELSEARKCLQDMSKLLDKINDDGISRQIEMNNLAIARRGHLVRGKWLKNICRQLYYAIFPDMKWNFYIRECNVLIRYLDMAKPLKFKREQELRFIRNSKNIGPFDAIPLHDKLGR